MSTSPDANDRLIVNIRTPRAGSCISAQFAAELSSLIDVSLRPTTQDAQKTPISTQKNNLASLDGQDAIYVPAGTFWRQSKTWLAASPDTVKFTEFTGFNIDATKAMLSFSWIPNSAETGVLVSASPSGTASIRPSVELVTRNSGSVEFKVYNAIADIEVTLELFAPAIPPEQA